MAFTRALKNQRLHCKKIFQCLFLHLRVAQKKSFQRILKKIRNFLLGLFIANFLFIILTKWVNTPITTVMIGSLLQGNGLQRDYIAFDEMGKNAKLAVICSEDQLFPDHNGFDWSAIKKAIKYNNNPKYKKVKGASTISQQTAKNVFLWNGRNWFRKGLEVYHTFMIEFIWGKQRILETYLNVAEMGKGIFGIQAAAQFYFKKNASALTKSEAAWIAAILPSPVRYSVQKPTSFLHKRHNWIVRQMNQLDGDPEIMALIK
ncbi:MAG: monofunctional biosynthetic peptidoglycan transglycosylase [Bacteroidetes bacterium]|nr:monofunctional biosynthetic peptidoglycan transglycosylase [Bacteroidota bacterium]